VVVDLRPSSPAYRRWFAVELAEGQPRALYVPEGVAHGFQTLTDDAVVQYQMSEFYHPESARGVRYDDPAFGVAWPLAVEIISARDAAYPPWGG
jgi:dTDP-4-dehydrorhamnose 3,5-epimerase